MQPVDEFGWTKSLNALLHPKDCADLENDFDRFIPLAPTV
jgi:hypothetical protein